MDSPFITEIAGIFNSFDEPICILDENYKIEWQNNSSKYIFGSKIIGKKFYEAFSVSEKECLDYIEKQLSNKNSSCLNNIEVKGNKGKKPVFNIKLSKPKNNKASKLTYYILKFDKIGETEQKIQFDNHTNIIFDNISLGVYVYQLEDFDDDKTLRLIAANKVSEELTGVKAKDIIGNTLDENFPGLRAKGIPQAYAEVIRKQEPLEIENMHYSDKNVVAGAYSIKAFPLENDKICVSFDNITERKRKELEISQKTIEIELQNKEIAIQNEEYITLNEELNESHKQMQSVIDKLAESENNYKLLFNEMWSGFAVHKMIYDSKNKPIDYIFLDVNQKYEELTGLKGHDIIDKRITSVLPEIDSEIIEKYGEVAITGIPTHFEYYSERRKKYFDIVAYSPVKDHFAVIINDTSVRKKSEILLTEKNKEIEAKNKEIAAQNEEFLAINEELQESYKVLQELNEKNKSQNEEYQALNKELLESYVEIKKVNELLAENEAYLNSLFKVAPIGIGVVVDRKFTFVNELMSKITGYKKEELIGKKSRILYPDEKEYEYVGKEKYGQIDKKGIGTVETKWKCKNGKLKNILLSSSPIDPKDLHKGVTFTALDITERKSTEEKLNQSKLMLQTVLDTIPVRVFWKDTTSYYLGCNKKFAHDAGLKNPEDIIGKTDFELVWKENAKRLIKTDNDVINTGLSLINYEETQKIQGKVNRWLKKSKIPLKEIDGKIIGVLGTYEDITNSKKARDKLKEREQTIRSIQEGISSKVGEKFFETIILTLGKTLQADYTYIAEIIGENKEKIRTIAICYRGRIIKNIEYHVLDTPCEKVLKENIHRFPRDVSSLFPKDQLLKELNIEGYIGVPLIDQHNNPVGLMVTLYKQPIADSKFGETVLRIFSTRTATEIERLKTELALKESEEKLATIFGSAPVMMMLINKEQNILKINQTGLVSANIDPDNAIGKKSGDILKCINSSNKGCGESEACVNCLIKNTIADTFDQKKDKYKVEATLPVKIDGKVKDHTILISTTLMKQLSPPNVLLTIDDITERKQIEIELKNSKEKAEESDKLKSAFLANMSHEIRTPMNGILGFTSLLNNQKLSEEKKKKYINIINSSSEQLLAIINDIIEISKIEAGQIKIINRKTNLNALLDSLYSQFDVERKFKKKQDIRFTLSKGLKDSESDILTDDIRLKQILLNLLSNAFKFTDKGNIEFGYRKENSSLLFYIKDSGVGISKDKQDIIFERFRQEDETHTRKFGGTGLGLAISKALSKLLGGEIWVESKKWQGATFFFTIKYNPIPIIKTRPVETKFKSEYQWKDKKILIVEDTEYAQQYLEEILDGTEVSYISVENGNEAIKACKENPDINLILMDIQLPDISGYETTKKIKEFMPDVKVIAQTAYGMSGDQEKAFNAGCDDYIAKPIIHNILLNKINKFLGEK